jgi:ribonuclease M5
MIKIDKVIIVEGRYDKIKLSSMIDGIIIETEGFGIFKDKDKQKLIRKLAETKGIAILTDSDSAGFVIRNFITSIVPKEYITNVYIPDIYGKEKRKDSPSKEGKLGVEGISSEILKEAFKKAGIGVSQSETNERKKITLNDFFDDGLTGDTQSKRKRTDLLKKLDLPERMSTKAMLDILNTFITYDEYKKLVESEEII